MSVTRQRKSEPIGTVIRRARASQHTRPQRREAGQPVRVAVADDSYLIRNALGEVLGQMASVELVATAEDGDGLIDAVETANPDVVLLDIRMPPGGDDEGIRVATQLRETHPDVGVIVLTQFSDARYALALLEGGAEGRGYLLKERVHDREELASAIDIVAGGGTMIDPTVIEGLIAADRRRRDSPLDDLTPREHEVLAEMAQGKSNAAIAESLVLTKRAVEKHVGAIFQKLALEDDEVVSRRVTAVLLYLSDGGDGST
ncbi:MAG TPA: response regulator transcription factor [Candidatus Limnocylindrales bacterium]|nr:response regulator transcription factor [Candidatus Limnocylindrales bacterium]